MPCPGIVRRRCSSLTSSSGDCIRGRLTCCGGDEEAFNDCMSSLGTSKEDFYQQLLELKRRNERRLKQLESQFKRRHSEAFEEDVYIYGECRCSYSPSSEEQLPDRRESVVQSAKDKHPESRKRRTRSAPALQKKQKTVIEPFSMTLREEQRMKDALALEESKPPKPVREDEEDEFVDRNFKASSVPKHVTKPLFRQMVLKHPQRYGGPKVSKYLHSESRLSKSMSDLNHFQAKPFPNHIFTDYAYERMKEAEEYRRVRRETRQKALLNEASFPSRMKSELEGFKGKLRKSKDEPKKRVRMRATHHSVPDFDHLYNKFQRSLELKKMTGKSSTVIQPFSFDGKYPQAPLQSEPKSRLSLCKPAPVTSPALRGKSTNAAKLREIANRNRIQSMEYDSQKRMLEKEALSRRQKELRRHPEWSRRLTDQPNTKEDINIRMIQRMEDEKERMLSYRMELKRIYDKVGSRPPLFIRQSQQSGTIKVEKFYNSALNREGLTEKEILEFLSGRSMSYDNIHLGKTYSKCSTSSSDLSGSVCLEEFGGGPSPICREHRELCSLNNHL